MVPLACLLHDKHFFFSLELCQIFCIYCVNIPVMGKEPHNLVCIFELAMASPNKQAARFFCNVSVANSSQYAQKLVAAMPILLAKITYYGVELPPRFRLKRVSRHNASPRYRRQLEKIPGAYHLHAPKRRIGSPYVPQNLVCHIKKLTGKHGDFVDD